MSTPRTATVSITNNTDGSAVVQLFHENSDYGTQSAGFIVGPGQTSEPMTVNFKTGIGSLSVLDWWQILVTVKDGSAPGCYRNKGTSLFPNWKECQLESHDENRAMNFAFSTSKFEVNLPSGGCTDDMEMYAPLPPAPPDSPSISHVFVLMLENRSFDNVFGQSGIPKIETAPAGTCNTYNGTKYYVGGGAPDNMPFAPSHGFVDVVTQLCGVNATYERGSPYPEIDRSGFVDDFAKIIKTTKHPDLSGVGDVMLGFDTPTDVPVLYQLATEFALCDQWFASMPGPTWPNRMFLHGASSYGLDHTPSLLELAGWETVDGFSFPNGSIYDRLNAAGLGWRIYCDDKNSYSDDPSRGSITGAIPQVGALKGIYLTCSINSLTHFASDLQQPYPYMYTFIEPNYGDVVGDTYLGGSSQHPVDGMYGGENLIKGVYEAIRNSPLWPSSVLVITYDEHGGFYDSGSPPLATPPGDGSGIGYNGTPYDASGFDFTQMGVRVPAVVVSPWVAQGVVDHTARDHSSVIATLNALFGIGHLTARDASVPDLTKLFTESAPRDDTPQDLVAPATAAPRATPTPAEDDAFFDDPEPMPTTGNLPGFLGVALKARLEMASSPVERQALIDEAGALTTRGEARRYLARTAGLVERARELNRARRVPVGAVTTEASLG